MNKATIIGATLTLLVIGVAAWAVWPAAPAAPVATPLAPPVPPTTPTSTTAIIGQSVQGRDLIAHTFGTGETDLLLVGGIHGGYEANTVKFAEMLVDHLTSDHTIIPDTITVHIIPNLNPDGYALPVTATDFDRRMNANSVDLNRNFDCRWQPESSWRDTFVSGGTEAFSEPEAAALRDYVLTNNPAAAVFWHSRANAVYTSECGEGVAAGGEELMNTYAKAADYNAAGLWTAYPVTGAAEDWLASLGIPAITVEFETRDSPEWERNWVAVQALLQAYE